LSIDGRKSCKKQGPSEPEFDVQEKKVMITRDDIRELAELQCIEEEEGCAVSFYFQPRTPQNKSHREEAILLKDLVRDTLRQAEKDGKNASLRRDLQRIVDVAADLHGNQARAKAMFACDTRHFWREFDIPPQLSGTQLLVNRRFHLKPLAALLGAHPRICVALLDRHKARVFDLRLDEVKEQEGLFRPLPRRGRGDGFAGYDGGHAERSVQDEALHHFKFVAEHLRETLEKDLFDNLIIGCQESNWHDLEGHLHPYLKKRMLGRFSADVGSIRTEQVREQAGRILRESQEEGRRDLVKEVISQAKSNSLGVTGLRRVLRSLELGEVQTLLVGQNYRAHAVECTGCGHLDAHMVRYCPACGRITRELEDVCDAIIPVSIRRDIELFYVDGDPEFDKVGNIAALLRFRTDQSKGGVIAVAS
jgi:peptide subunit release factor 1 (eRF1)